MARQRQTEKLNEEQFDENEIFDEYSEEIETDENNEDEQARESMGNALSSFKLSSGAIIATVVVLVLIILAIVFFKPFSGDNADGTGFSIGKFFGRDGSLGSDVLGDNSTLSYADSLIQYLEGYTVADNGDGTYTVEGMKDDLKHIMIYDGDFNIITETIGDNTTEYVLDEETGERVPSSPLTESNTIVPEQNAEIVEGEDMVKVDRWNYEHSQLGMKPVDLNVEYDANGIAVAQTYEDRFIVEYTKLPLRGHTAQVFVKIMDTDTELIFNIGINSYLKLEESGASMISAKVTEIGGQKLFHDVKFTKWK